MMLNSSELKKTNLTMLCRCYISFLGGNFIVLFVFLDMSIFLPESEPAFTRIRSMGDLKVFSNGQID